MNSKIEVLKKMVSRPSFAAEMFLLKTARLWPDKLYISIMYLIRFGKKLNWDTPTTFNEKLNWEKLYNQNPLYAKMVDKYEAKNIVRERIGEQYVVPCYGVWEKIEDIPFTDFPNRFVIKATHDSGGVIVCKDKTRINFEEVKQRLRRSLKRNWFFPYREWAYRDVKPRIIVDEYLTDNVNTELRDYKFWCFNGVPKFIYLTNKGSNIIENFYDMDFNPVSINHGFKRHQPEFSEPQAFEEMKQLAAKLSEGIPFVRIDFFCVAGKVYFGEFTFYDWAGMRPFESLEDEILLGDMIDLKQIHD